MAEDSGDTVALQHVLQTNGGRVIKHWKQIWMWEDRRIVEFQGRGEWRVRELTEGEAAGTWSQLVTQVDDSPRYEGVGKWNHVNGVSLWESNRTSRPLPRREHTVRDDYDILRTVNRHALTPQGWVHEQDSLKLTLERDGKPADFVVSERGVNYYDRTDKVDFGPSRAYWEKTGPFWRKVFDIWKSIMKTESRFTIADEVGGRPLYEAMFEMADDLVGKDRDSAPFYEQIRESLDR